MVFLSQGVRRWKGVSEEGGRERSALMNYLQAGKGNIRRVGVGEPRRKSRGLESEGLQDEEAQGRDASTGFQRKLTNG